MSRRRLALLVASAALAPTCAAAAAPPEVSGVVVVGRAPLSGGADRRGGDRRGHCHLRRRPAAHRRLAENLADARYETSGTFAQTSAVFLREAPGASNPRSLTPDAPRTFGLGLRLSF